MKLKLTESFIKQLSRQVSYIAFDKPEAAKKFKADILSEVKFILKFPLKNRQSIYFEEEKIRDLIFKGYVITYEVSRTEIIVFAFTKYREFED